MELRDYLRILRRRWVSILLVALVAGGVALGLTLVQTPQYASTARLFVSTSSTDDATLLSGGQFSAQRVKSYADLVTSHELAARVNADLGLGVEPSNIAQKASAEVVLDTVNLTLTVTDSDPHDAQQIAQSYAENLTDLVRELERAPGESNAPVKATIVDNASFSDTPVSPNKVRNVGLGLVLGLLAGFGLAVLREVLDTRVNSTEELEAVVDAPTLGTIAFDAGAAKAPLISDIPPHSPRSEAFRVLRTNLQFVDVDNPHKVFVITSAVPEEGKTTTSINLAISLAQAGTRTLLIEGDLRRPKAIERLSLDGAVGVTSVLVGKVILDDAIQLHGPTGLHVLASGPIPPNPAELLQSNAMEELLADLRSRYDVVIIDAPPLLPVTDAALLSAKADGAILAVRHGKVTKDQVAHAVERLKNVDAELVGTLLSMVPNRGRFARYGGYGYGYGYGYSPALPAAPESSKQESHSKPGRRRGTRQLGRGGVQ